MEMLTPRVTKRQTLADGIMAMSHRSYAPVASRSGNTGGRHALALQGLPRRALGNLFGTFTIQGGSLFWQPTYLIFLFFSFKIENLQDHCIFILFDIFWKCLQNTVTSGNCVGFPAIPANLHQLLDEKMNH